MTYILQSEVVRRASDLRREAIDQSNPRPMYRQGTDERGADDGRELTLLLRGLMSQYRDLHEGKAPERIYASPDIFASLERERDPSFALKRPGPGYTFEGVSIEPKLDQSLPFALRP